MTELDDSWRRISSMVFTEFSDIGDFVWKNPRLLENERKIELHKLEAYFPLSGDTERDASALERRARRWSLESRKLENTFPI